MINTDSVAKPKYVLSQGKRVPTSWPKWNPAQAAHRINARYHFSYLDMEQGLNSGSIQALLEARDGRIWIGTHGGALSVWDGAGFAHFSVADGLSQNDVRSLLEDREGRIWIGTMGGGLSVWDGTVFTHYTTADGLSHNVRSLLEDREGNIWIATEGGGLSVWDGNGFTQYTTAEGLTGDRIWALLEDREGKIWIGTEGGLCVWNGQGFTHYTTANGLNHNVQSLLEDREGKIWIGTPGPSLSVWDGEGFAHYTTAEGLTGDRIMALLEDRDGRIWIGTFEGGLNVWDGKGLTQYSTEEGLSDNRIFSLLEDREGRIWIGTAEGVSLWDRAEFTRFTQTEGLSHNGVWSLLEDQSGRVWIGTPGPGLSVWDGAGFTQHNIAEFHRVGGLLADRQGKIWIGKMGDGLRVWDEEGFIHYTSADGLINDFVWDLLEDRQGKVWIGTEGGVSIWDGSGFTNYTMEHGLSNNEVHTILEDRQGSIWMGTWGGGLSVWDGSGFTRFTETEGLGDNFVACLLEDRDGKIWIGSPNRGLSVWDGEGFTHYTKEHGLSHSNIWSLLEDKWGDIWVGTVKGLNRLRKLDDAIGLQTYLNPDGLGGLTVRTMLMDRRQRLWLGGPAGVDILDLSIEKSDATRPSLLLRDLQVFYDFVDWRRVQASANMGEPLLVGEQELSLAEVAFDSVRAFTNLPLNAELPHNVNQLTLSWSGLHGTAPHKLQYSHLLEGKDTFWSPPVLDTKVTYTDLRPGDYTFKVRAVGGNGKWSNTAAYSFAILPPWWLTWWAKTSYALMGLFLIAGYIRWRTVAFERRQRELEQTVTERTAQLEAQKRLISKEKERSEELMLNILPSEIAKELMETGQTQPVRFEEVSVLFIDFKGFTNIVATMPAKGLVHELNEIFQHFDDIVQTEGLEKIKTLGDGYLAASGVPKEDPGHAIKCVRAAKSMNQFLNKRNEGTGVKWNARIGIHSGPVTAGVVGKSKFVYDVFGDTVNIASRIESSGEEGRINVSAYTYDLIKDVYPCEYRGKINAKGKGEIDMYFVN